MTDLLMKLGIEPNLSVDETMELLQEKNLEYLERIQSCQDDVRREELLKLQEQIEEAIDSLSMGILIAADAQTRQSESNREKTLQDQYLEAVGAYKNQGYKHAFAVLETFARQGDLTAQIICGDCQLHLGSLHEAKRWFYLAAEQGEISGMLMLARCYMDENNLTAAEEWAIKAAEGHTREASKLMIKIKDIQGKPLEAYRWACRDLFSLYGYEYHVAMLEAKKRLSDILTAMGINGDSIDEQIDFLNKLKAQSQSKQETEIIEAKLLEKQEELKVFKKREKAKRAFQRKFRIKTVAVILVLCYLIYNTYNYFVYVEYNATHSLYVHIPNYANGVISYPKRIFFKPVISVSAADSDEIKGIKLKEGLTDLHMYDTGITDLTIPSSMKDLSLKLNRELQSIDLSKCENLEELVFSGGDLTGKLDLSNCKKLSKMTVTNVGINEIIVPESAGRVILGGSELSIIDFSKCKKQPLVELVGLLPENLIIDEANLGVVKINGRLTSLTWGDEASASALEISSCNDLTTLNISQGVPIIRIYKCYDLENIMLPKGVTNFTMEECDKIKNISLPEETTWFNIKDCPNLETVIVYSLPGDSNAFSKCESLKTVYVPNELIDEYKEFFSGLFVDGRYMTDVEVLPIESRGI
ncbi:MAG: leucine-rich repeat protein [Clostridiales bacterium]|nr:leucine-rich repeat protein [Clostridiales bacterium]